jgi:hypothetical protein
MPILLAVIESGFTWPEAFAAVGVAWAVAWLVR